MIIKMKKEGTRERIGNESARVAVTKRTTRKSICGLMRYKRQRTPQKKERRQEEIMLRMVRKERPLDEL